MTTQNRGFRSQPQRQSQHQRQSQERSEVFDFFVKRSITVTIFQQSLFYAQLYDSHVQRFCMNQ